MSRKLWKTDRVLEVLRKTPGVDRAEIVNWEYPPNEGFETDTIQVFVAGAKNPSLYIRGFDPEGIFHNRACSEVPYVELKDIYKSTSYDVIRMIAEVKITLLMEGFHVVPSMEPFF